MSVTTIMLILLTVAVVVEFVLLLALARELGRVQVRLGPVGARVTDAGPAVGRAGPVIAGLRDHRGARLTLGGPSDHDTLVMFVSPKCVACASLLPGLRTLARSERRLDIVLLADGDPADHEAFLAEHDLGSRLSYVVSMDAGMQYRAGVTPYGVLLDHTGTVRSKGLCNHLQQVESLLNARDTGYATLQELSAALDDARHQSVPATGPPIAPAVAAAPAQQDGARS